MAEWGHGPFENDFALNFVGDLEEGTPTAIKDRLLDSWDVIMSASVREDQMCSAIAGAVLVAMKAGGPDPGHAPVTDWLATAPFDVDEELRAGALKTLDRCIDETGNEWYEILFLTLRPVEIAAIHEPWREALRKAAP